MFGFPWTKKESARRPDQPFGPRVEQLEAREVPTVVAIGDTYRVAAGQVLTVNAGRNTAIEGPGPVGVLANDFSDTNPGAVLAATRLTVAKYVSPTGASVPALPAQALVFNADGSFTFTAPAAGSIPQSARDIDGSVRVQFQYQAKNTLDPTEPVGTATVTVTIQNTTTHLIAVSPDAGTAPVVNIFNSGSGTPSVQIPSIMAYEQSFTAGVRVAVGDVNDDGVDDVITVPAVSGGPRVRAFDGRNGAVLADFFAFDPAFRGGGYVAVGDFTGDGRNDIIVGAGEGGGPRVQVYSLNINASGQITGGQTLITDFFAYEPGARNGVRVAAGDLKGIGRDSIITAPGEGGGPRIRVFDRTNVLGSFIIGPNGLPVSIPGQTPVSANGASISYLDFYATDSTNRSGVFIAAGNLDGSGAEDIITGTGAGAGIVRVFDGATGGLTREFAVPNDELPAGGGTTGGPSNFAIQNTTSGSLLAPGLAVSSLVPSALTSLGRTNPLLGAINGGARVSSTDYNGDGLDEIVVGSGAGVQPRVRIIDPRNQSQITSILAFDPAFLGGINVAAD